MSSDSVIELWGQQARHYLELQHEFSRCKHLLDRLDNDALVEVCSFLDVESLISMVKALDHPRLRHTHDRIASVSVNFDPVADFHLQVDVMLHLRRVRWKTSDVSFMHLLKERFPLYEVICTIGELSPMKEEIFLPNVTEIHQRLDFLHETITHWPPYLRVLSIVTEMTLITVSLPQTLTKFSIEANNVHISSAIPRLKLLRVYARDLKTAFDGPIHVKRADLQLESDEKLQQLVNRLNDLHTLFIISGQVTVPASVQRFEYGGLYWPRDPRLTDLKWFGNEPLHALPNLENIHVIAMESERLHIEAPNVQTMLVYYADPEITCMVPELSQPSRLTSLTIRGNTSELNSISLASLKSFVALETFLAQDISIGLIDLDAPKLSSVTIRDCKLKQFLVLPNSRIKELVLASNILESLPSLPDTLETLELSDNSDLLDGHVEIYAVGLRKLNLHDTLVKSVYYNSKRLQFVCAEWDGLHTFRQIDLLLPPNLRLSGWTPEADMLDLMDSFDPKWKWGENMYTSGWQDGLKLTAAAVRVYKQLPVLPVLQSTVVLHITSVALVEKINWVHTWAQVPKLKFLTIDFRHVNTRSLPNTLILPPQLLYVKLIYPDEDDEDDEDEPTVQVSFTSTPTSLVGITVMNREDPEGKLMDLQAHPNLKHVHFGETEEEE